MNKKSSKTNDKRVNTSNKLLKKLSLQKRNEINQLVDKLLKVSSFIQPTPNASKEWENHLEIVNILSKIRKLESDMKVPLPERSALFEEFYNWLKSNGALFEGLKIGKFSGYDYGVQAEKDFCQGDLLIAIPRKLMLTSESAKNSLLGPLIRKDPLLQHMPNVALALQLLVEKHSSNSFWKPYISILPETYTTILYFQTADLQELKGSPSLEAALKQCRHIARQYSYFNKLFQTTSDPASDLLRDIFTYEEYCWAVSTVMSRQNFVPAEDGSGSVHALIPMWDMCNHEEGLISTEYNSEAERSECLATRVYKPSEQVFIYYGPRNNSEFMIHNGFVYLGNKQDFTKIKLGIGKSDPLTLDRQKLLNRLDMMPSGEFLINSGSEPIDGDLMAFLRVFNMNKDQLEFWLSSDNINTLKDLKYIFDSEVESKTWLFLLTRIKLLLSSYSTSIEDDEILLEGCNLSGCRKLAIMLRLSEKKILQHVFDYVKNQTNKIE